MLRNIIVNAAATHRMYATRTRTVRALGGKHVSAVGIGSLRASDQHADAIIAALAAGCSVVDTGDHFAGGTAMPAVGRALHKAFEQGITQRNDVVIVSKAGVVWDRSIWDSVHGTNGASLHTATALRDGIPLHCLHPLYIRASVERTLNILQLDHIDIMLLNGPERLALDPRFHDPNRIEETMHTAFLELERLVTQGLICHYGVSSSQFAGSGVAAPNALPSQDKPIQIPVLPIDRTATPHYAAVSMPFNLFESGPVITDGASAATVAADAGLLILWQRPLTAILKDKVLRLETPRVASNTNGMISSASSANDDFADIVETFGTELDSLTRLERTLRDEVPPEFVDTLSNGEIISTQSAQLLANFIVCDVFVNLKVRPTVRNKLARLRKEILAAIEDDEALAESVSESMSNSNKEDVDDSAMHAYKLQQERHKMLHDLDVYESQLGRVLDLVLRASRHDMAEKNISRLEAIRSLLRNPKDPRASSLANLAVAACVDALPAASTCTLVGMRDAPSVEALLKGDASVLSIKNGPLFKTKEESIHFFQSVHNRCSW